MQFLDGPYKTFLASVKLEAAYRRISQGRPFPRDDAGSTNKQDKEGNKQHPKWSKDTQEQDDGVNGQVGTPSAPQLQQLPHAGAVGATSTEKHQRASSSRPSSARSRQVTPSQQRKPTHSRISPPSPNLQSQQLQQQHAQPAVVDQSPRQSQPPSRGVQGGVVYPLVSNALAAVGEDQVQRLQVQTWDD
jgi:hypothetical protein